MKGYNDQLYIYVSMEALQMGPGLWIIAMDILSRLSALFEKAWKITQISQFHGILSSWLIMAYFASIKHPIYKTFKDYRPFTTSFSYILLKKKLRLVLDRWKFELKALLPKIEIIEFH